ncbi:uncharacterized protein EDB91DRAFT_1150311 [Suillus paluster]|uniref:uncharacterized protein n=1 Tax=Suillus paluster TaxID=48578 RepID=UPI001B8647F4|nr:uncharacterized protein EDB91DRAFT_1150311 [Suillus paluster]KAG1733062.1 hypothetical protein EDB91DRAFT_1150311 [Suillus paluster]
MRFSFLVVVAALIASMSVNATPAIIGGRGCFLPRWPCDNGDECCSGYCQAIVSIRSSLLCIQHSTPFDPAM